MRNSFEVSSVAATVDGHLKAHHPLGNFVAATLETSKEILMNLIMTMLFMRNSFEVSSVAATKLPSGWWA